MRIWLIVLFMALAAAPAWAGSREADDLRRQIDVQRAGAGDLERLDERRSVTEDITLLRAWIDEAVTLHQKEEFDDVRKVLDRCAAQSELIRQRIIVSKLTAQAVEREGAVERAKEKVARTRAAIEQGGANQKAPEMNAK
jgi:hypothetical protein